MSKKTVLIVDDSMAMRRMIAFTLESSGFSVIQGNNGVEGLERLNEHPADLIIADVNMPVMDGITFVRHARTLPGFQSIPILMLTTENLKVPGIGSSRSRRLRLAGQAVPARPAAGSGRPCAWLGRHGTRSRPVPGHVL